MTSKILILDFGSQYTRLVARRVRDLNVYCEVFPFSHIPPIDEATCGIILSGGPQSVRDTPHPDVDFSAFQGLPTLGVCYGAQLMAHREGGEVSPSRHREYGQSELTLLDLQSDLLDPSVASSTVWMSHSDTITALPSAFSPIASTASAAVAAFRHVGKPWYGLQFHPEVEHTVYGRQILSNFLFKICGCKPEWTSSRFVENTVHELVEQLGDDKVVMALSGGVDSTVAATLIHRAIGSNLHCIFVDNGLLRAGEFEQVNASYVGLGLPVKAVDASQRFYNALRSLTDPEAKRKAVGKAFIDVFERAASQIPGVKWLGQGTIYPDIIESRPIAGPSAVIKSHHNVGGLPENMYLKMVEPISTLFKDEVRRVGAKLGIDTAILHRHPFPGPGLAIRILGEVTPEKVSILQQADRLFIEGLRRFDLYDKVWQAGTILLPIQSVGVMGDERTYEGAVALRAVTGVDGMTADWARLPHDFLQYVSSAIINQVKGINRVVYDISSKPPSTIEWE